MQVREVILSLLQKHKSVKRKAIVECLHAEGVSMTDKALTSALKVTHPSVCVCVCV